MFDKKFPVKKIKQFSSPVQRVTAASIRHSVYHKRSSICASHVLSFPYFPQCIFMCKKKHCCFSGSKLIIFLCGTKTWIKIDYFFVNIEQMMFTKLFSMLHDYPTMFYNVYEEPSSTMEVMHVFMYVYSHICLHKLCSVLTYMSAQVVYVCV